jgi:hypothetical protein
VTDFWWGVMAGVTAMTWVLLGTLVTVAIAGKRGKK